MWNPASDLELPRKGRRLPHHVLTLTEVERVLAVPNVREGLGLRDRAILEVLFGTGIGGWSCAALGSTTSTSSAAPSTSGTARATRSASSPSGSEHSRGSANT
jgi:site-specific recombinase XerD